MKMEKVTEVFQKAIAQSLGDEYMTNLGDIAAIDSYKLVDVGKDVLDGQNTTEKFTNSLVSLIGKMEIDSEEYIPDLPSMFIAQSDWGWFIERVKFDLLETLDDPTFSLENGKSYADIEHTFYQPKVKVKVFEECAATMTPCSFQRATLREAFRNWNEMDKFISGIQTAIRNTLAAKAKALAHATISAGIAISDKATQTAVHLLTEMKEQGIATAEMTAEQALNNEECQRYILSRISETRGYMSDFGVSFNNGSIPTFTTKDKNVLVLLNHFVNKAKFNVRANTYNENLIGVGDYETVNMWQAVKSDDKKYTFDVLSKIMISADADNKLGLGTEAVTISNVIGVAYDKKAMGIYGYDDRVTSSYTACADFWTDFHHKANSRIIDSDYNIVAFILD